MAASTDPSHGRLDAFLTALQARGDGECMVADGTRYSYADLLRAIGSAQRDIVGLGHVPDSVIALRADYSLWSVAAFIALLAARTTVAMLPRDRDPAPLMADCRAVGLLDVDLQGEWNWMRLSGPSTSQAHPLLTALHATGDSGIVLFTSGSSGRPKAALQSVDRFLAKFTRPGKRLRTLAFLLFDHVAGLDTLLYTLANGGTVVITRDRSPAAVCRLIEDASVEVLSASPTFLRLLCLAGDAGGPDLSSLKVITYGSEPMDPRTLALLNERFPGCRISQKYGTTETGSPRSMSRDNNSLWLKLAGDGVEAKVVDGVLHLRSESTILGYLNAPSSVDAEGWYCTGDLVDVDGEWIRIRGRSSDQINVGGEKVSPSEVEHALLELDFVREAVVSGEPSAIMGQIVTARIVLSEAIEEQDAMRRIRVHCRSRLAPHMIPVKITFGSASLRTTRQKVQRILPR